MATTDKHGKLEEGEACLDCTKNRTYDMEDRHAAAIRKVSLLTAIVALLCAVTLAACASSVCMYYKVNAMRTEIIETTLKQDSNDYYYNDAEYLTDDTENFVGYDVTSDEPEASARLTTRSKRRKEGKSRRGCKGSKHTKAACKCCVKKVRSLIKSGLIDLPVEKHVPQPTTTKVPVIKESAKAQHFVAAAHYTTMVDNDYIRRLFPPIDYGNADTIEKCRHVSEWNGKLCRNRTFSSPDAPTTLKMFKESNWMKNTTKLFDLQDDGSFVAKHTGIYLLYAHPPNPTVLHLSDEILLRCSKVLFFDVKTKQALGLLHESDGKAINHFRCMESVDYVNPALALTQNARYKSCSVNGVLLLEAGDIIKVQSLYSDTEIDVTKDATYFGGFLFSVK